MFESGSAAAVAAGVAEPGEYPCPICKGKFDRSAGADGRLTLEHVPPESMGGKPIILTCRNCNSFAGHELDAEADNREAIIAVGDALAGRRDLRNVRARINLGGQRVNVVMHVESAERRITFDVHDHINDPDALREQLAWLEGAAREQRGDGVEFQMTPRIRWHERRAQISDLRSAYLLCFAALGFKFAFDSRLDVVRRQIMDPDSAAIDVFALNPGGNAMEVPAIILAKEPFSCIVVRLLRSLVVLPCLTGPTDTYDRVSSLAAAELNFRGPVIEVPNDLRASLDFKGSGPGV